MISIGNLQINKLCLGDVAVSKAYLGDVEVYGSTPQPVGKYMTITALDYAAGETVIKPTWNGTSSYKPNLQYRINNREWSDFIVGTTADIHLTAGNFVQFNGNNPEGISDYRDQLIFSISGNPVSLSGSIMSLIDGVGETTLIPSSYCFYKLFLNSNVKAVSSDFLPATTLANSCYTSMFAGCTSLETAPALHATTLDNSCYDRMFSGCTALTTAPALPATTLARACYNQMFQGCTALTTAPVLPATTLAVRCYNSMFIGCTALTTAPVLPATTLAESCYSHMFDGCTALTTAPALPVTTLAVGCYGGMFANCSSLVNAPELPATTLADSCYGSMFHGCTSLTTAPALPATTLVTDCYYYMFNGCSNLQHVTCLATNISATDCTTRWLSGVASTGTFVKTAGVSYTTGASGIPNGWTVVEPKYMTMTVDSSAGETTISPTVKGNITPNLQYRVNNGSWTDFIVGTTADIVVGAGDVVQWKGLNKDGLSIDTKNYLNFSISNPVHLSGNVMSLIDGFGETLVIPNNYCFYKLFSTSKIKTVSSDFLPATGLTSYCYQFMFERCSNLTQAPSLPANTITPYCYNRMFLGCSSLTQAPALPATTLAQNCYENMFENCSSLTQAPALPATTIAHSCYSFMFNGCENLTQAPTLPATTLAQYCYYYMFGGCSKLTQAPVLNATTLKTYCYAYMFNGCSKLNYVKSLAVNGFNNYGVISSWLSGVASKGTFVKPAGVSYETGKSGIPSGWTIQNI